MRRIKSRCPDAWRQNVRPSPGSPEGYGIAWCVDFLPIAGDIKDLQEAESAIDYLAAVIGIFPPVTSWCAGAIKAIKQRRRHWQKGDLESAPLRLINKASDDIQVKWVDENAE